MHTVKTVGKREFIQNTSKYLKLVENDEELIITHHNEPDIILKKIKKESFDDLRGFTTIRINEDINEHILPGYDEWSS